MRGVPQMPQELRHLPEIVGRVVRKDEQAFLPALSGALSQQVQGLLRPEPQVALATRLALGVEAIGGALLFVWCLLVPGPHVLVHVEPNHFQAKFRVLLEPVVAGHVEVVQIVLVSIHLSALLRVRSACARVALVVMIAIDTVPRDRAEVRRINVPPLHVPLRIRFGCHTMRVERITHIDNELHIPEAAECLEHLVRNGLLTVHVVGVPVNSRVPTPVSYHKEGGHRRSTSCWLCIQLGER
mmetsp:Transcript_72017/g.166793  ORF Transcript_72017/g.166793 Transcript_72017/m.166793 type:complete len:241 (-) Transcript_72017:256-978(-)